MSWLSQMEYERLEHFSDFLDESFDHQKICEA